MDGLFARALHEEAGGVPDLVREVAAAFQLLVEEAEVVAGGAAGRHREAESVGAVLVHDRQRVDDVAAALRHLVALIVADHAVQVDMAEGYFAGVVEAGHDHPRHPEEEDVVTRLQHRRRIPVAQVIRIFRPAECGVRPKRRGEPRVEHVRVLLYVV